MVTTTVAATATNEVLASLGVAPSAVQATAVAGGVNVQTFTGTLGGPPPPVVSTAGAARPFSVDGDTFVGSGAAIGRSCDKQHNACANAANSGKLAGGVGQCDQQNSQCRAANNLRRVKRAADLGSCSNPTIKFAAGLDGRKEESFIANNLSDFNHGSAQKIGIIAGFICQRLADSCKAPADVVASCTSASAAAVATTQNQAAADVFNKLIEGAGGVGDVQVVTKAPAKPAATGGAVVLTVTSCT